MHTSIALVFLLPLLLCISRPDAVQAQDDSLAGSFLSGEWSYLSSTDEVLLQEGGNGPLEVGT